MAMTKSKKEEKKNNREFSNLKDYEDGSSASIEHGEMWLKNGRYVPGFSVNLDEVNTLSDFQKMIVLENVELEIGTNKAGYKFLTIKGK